MAENEHTGEDAGSAAADAGVTEATGAESPRARNARKQRTGVVTSARAHKTVTVIVQRRRSHPLYGKQVTWTKRYHAHDEKDECREGDVVRIQETRPLSKTKRWRVVELIERPE